jgi:integrase
MDEGEFVATNTITLKGWLDIWLKDYAPHDLEETTLAHYTSTLNAHIIPDLGHIELQRLTSVEIQRAVTVWSERLAASSIKYQTAILKQALNQAVKAGVLKRTPMEGVKLPKVRKSRKAALTEEEMGKLINATRGTKLYLPVLMAATTGMRRGEVLGLKWDAINGNVATVREVISQGSVIKGPKTELGYREIVLSDRVVEALKERKRQQREEQMKMRHRWKDSGYVFTRIDGGPWKPQDITGPFGRLIKKVDIPHVCFHELRHTHATHLIKAGVPIQVIANRLGHDPEETMRTYAHMLKGMDQDAANIVDGILASMGQ